MQRILSIQQFPDTAYRASKLAAALKNEYEQTHIISLDFESSWNFSPEIMPITLAEYLVRFGHSLNLVLIDAPQSLLLAQSYLKRLCPEVPILVNLRAGPLMEFQAVAQGLTSKIVKSMHSMSAVLLTGPAERAYASNLGLREQLCFEIATPFSSYSSARQQDPRAVSLVGDFSHQSTLSKTTQLIPLLSAMASALGLKLFAEGRAWQSTKLPELPPSIQPEVRIFVSDQKDYDNAAILSSLQLGVVVIASDAAAFGLGLAHTREYLAANHPVTIEKQLLKLGKNPGLVKRLKQAGKTFIQHNHFESRFLDTITDVRARLPSYVAPGLPLADPIRAGFQSQTIQNA